MKLCYIISGDLWAGVEVMCYRLLKGLLNYNNLELSVILLNEGKLAEEIRKLKIPVYVVDETRLNFFQIVRNFRNIIIEISPDIIHSHRLKENILAYLSIKSETRWVQLLSTQHGMQEPLICKYKAIKQYVLTKYNYYIIVKYFKYIIAVSEDIRKNIIQMYSIPNDKVFVIHNGTYIESEIELSLEREKNSFVIGSAGRLFPIKDYPFMVEIAREVLNQANQVRFELAGEGPEMENIHRLICAYKIEKSFILRGFIDKMETFYQGLDLYINTSLHEGLPMSVIEAMAHGIPVIAPNTGGLVEILNNGSQGYLIEGRNPKIFAEKCLKLIRDKDLYQKMGIASRDKIQNEFSMYKMAENYHNLYLNVFEHNSNK